MTEEEEVEIMDRLCRSGSSSRFPRLEYPGNRRAWAMIVGGPKTMDTHGQEMARLQEYYAKNGSIVVASVDRLPTGRIQRPDWNDDGMEVFRWSVIGESNLQEFEAQRTILDFTCLVDPRFRCFYRVEALD